VIAKTKQTRTERERQAIRLKQFLIAAATYAVAIPLLLLAYVTELIALLPAISAVALVAAFNLVLFVIFKTDANLKFKDPSITHAQTTIGIVFVMYVAYHFNHDRGLVLIWCLVVLLFGVFSFRTRQFIVTTLVMLAGYALVINLLMIYKPETVNVYLEWFQWITLALVLPAFAMIGARISELRAKLAANNAELVNALSTIQVLANHDSLTGLPNRAMFNDNLQHAIARASRSRMPLGLFFIDLDNFKQINDTQGHPFGDSVLREAVRRFSSFIRDGDTLARFGGDEFALLAENLKAPGDVQVIGQKFVEVLKERAMVEGVEVKLSASIGIATYPEHGLDSQTLLANADIALYRAKADGRGRFCQFSSSMSEIATAQFQMERELRRALDEDRLRIHYQPKIDIRSDRVTGVEALIRWEHPEHGLVYPEHFIRMAEGTGIIIPIGGWMLKKVCERTRAWEAEGMPAILVSINLSASQLLHPDFVEDCAKTLKSYGRKPELFEFEITGSKVMQNPQRAARLMEELREIGVRLAIDDFGTGYSTLAYLKQFPVHTLKIDQHFVRDLPHNRDDAVITRAIIAMAHGINMTVLAKGVERAEQLHFLAKEGCDEFQGYLFAKALPEEELLPFLRKRLAK